ncbi:tyrosyl-DNA phosphodiesterase-domain-containing protein [Mycena maculata]|uniref:Tyrosyl-DNA phosphodiesterase-domain-containing protein n=1 Tax=Mycena maculata TaxID=230809 RepID=A0AAD7K7R2_9AGAR|nr:tyrosyl-DNA phosphodiesterase-domain-containing protein [Mycena maculata]
MIRTTRTPLNLFRRRKLPSGPSRKSHATKPIVLDASDPEDSDAAESIPRKAVTGIKPQTIGSTGSSVTKRKEQEPIPSVPSGPLGSLADRAQMEADRLARRKRMLQDEEMAGDSKRQRISGTTVSSTPKTPLASRMFYDGVFFPTATLHANPRADGREAIRFEDIVGPADNSIQLAILSSFGFSPEWLAPHFDSSVPLIIVAGTGREEDGPSLMTDFFQEWVQTCPRLGKGGCMHMKYMLLFYKTGRLRVVISTANLIPLDWNHLENHVFIQDISLNGSSGVIGNIPFAENAKLSSSKAKPEESFVMVLESVLKATNVGPALEKLKQRKSELPLNSIADLSKMWDWRNVRVELVTSLAGNWEGWKQVRATGHPRLMRAIENLGLATNATQNLVVECQGSSIGTYTTQWFNQFYLSASGHSSALKAHMDLSEGRRKKLEYPLGIKVVFPSLETVKRTSEHGASSLFCTRKKWEVKNFPRAAFHDSKSQAGRVLMHTKMIIGSFTPKRDVKPESSNAAGWMYVGSHNFTSPAWGNLSGSVSAPVLNVNNFELGVVVPLETAGDVNKASAWERPPRKYTAADLPWLKDENATDFGM